MNCCCWYTNIWTSFHATSKNVSWCLTLNGAHHGTLGRKKNRQSVKTTSHNCNIFLVYWFLIIVIILKNNIVLLFLVCLINSASIHLYCIADIYSYNVSALKIFFMDIYRMKIWRKFIQMLNIIWFLIF